MQRSQPSPLSLAFSNKRGALSLAPCKLLTADWVTDFKTFDLGSNSSIVGQHAHKKEKNWINKEFYAWVGYSGARWCKFQNNKTIKIFCSFPAKRTTRKGSRWWAREPHLCVRVLTDWPSFLAVLQIWISLPARQLCWPGPVSLLPS